MCFKAKTKQLYVDTMVSKRHGSDPGSSSIHRRAGPSKKVESQNDEQRFCRYDQTSERIVELARPKEPRSIWITSCGAFKKTSLIDAVCCKVSERSALRQFEFVAFGKSDRPRVMWGTQETLWPVSDAALSHEPTPRVKELAWPKRNFQTGDKVNRPEFMYSCGRSSVLWEVSPGAMEVDPSDRLLLLSQHKKAPQEFIDKEDRRHFVFSCGRSSPIWRVSSAARATSCGTRLGELARPKTTHKEYQPMRSVQTIIPKPALSGRCTNRLETLAGPKNREEGPFREPQWMVTDGAKGAVTSQRVAELSKPKGLVDGYVPRREVIWPVSRSARKATCTSRLDEISKPIIRATMDHVQFDPDAFLVKESALKARCSNRLNELAEPLKR